MIAAVQRRPAEGPPWRLLLEGLVSIAAGIVTFALPRLTALVLAVCDRDVGLVIGVLEIVAALRIRRQIAGELWLIALLVGLAFRLRRWRADARVPLARAA